jgi:hypothetical protein
MGTQETGVPRPNPIVPTEGGESPWVGWLIFAGVMMIVLGAFNLILALTALVESDVLVATGNSLLIFSYPVWGWLWLMFGLLAVVAGLGVLGGQTWARAVGVVLAVLNALGHMAFISAAPFWSSAVIALDVLVIYVLTTHGAELGQRYYTRR